LLFHFLFKNPLLLFVLLFVLPVVPGYRFSLLLLLSESRGLPRSHFVVLNRTSVWCVFKLPSSNASFFFRCQWHSCGRTLLHFAAGLFLSFLRALRRSIFGNNRIYHPPVTTGSCILLIRLTPAVQCCVPLLSRDSSSFFHVYHSSHCTGVYRSIVMPIGSICC
jgi:hypothetical protein